MHATSTAPVIVHAWRYLVGAALCTWRSSDPGRSRCAREILGADRATLPHELRALAIEILDGRVCDVRGAHAWARSTATSSIWRAEISACLDAAAAHAGHVAPISTMADAICVLDDARARGVLMHGARLLVQVAERGDAPTVRVLAGVVATLEHIERACDAPREALRAA